MKWRRLFPLAMILLLGLLILLPILVYAQPGKITLKTASGNMDSGIPGDNLNHSGASDDAVPIATAWSAVALTMGLAAMGIWLLCKKAPS